MGCDQVSDYYPYYPVGAIRDNLLTIRSRRLKQTQEPGLFLMIGSAFYGPTREGFSWFIQQAALYGLPAGMRVIIAGRYADALNPSQTDIPGLEFHGWVEQTQLDDWLCRVQGVLAPQWRGFGAITRLSEMSCAGVPIIIPEYLTYVTDPLPNVWTAGRSWQSWLSTLEKVMAIDSQSLLEPTSHPSPSSAFKVAIERNLSAGSTNPS